MYVTLYAFRNPSPHKGIGVGYQINKDEEEANLSTLIPKNCLLRWGNDIDKIPSEEKINNVLHEVKTNLEKKRSE